MNPCVVNVSTGRYIAGQRRLKGCVDSQADFLAWADCLPPHSPPHHEYPYAFKAHAIAAAVASGYEQILWADACIRLQHPLDAIWERAARDGAWISRNGWKNYEWSADTFYEHAGITRQYNWLIPHVVATTFALDLRHPSGRAIYDEYFRLSNTPAIQGPWWNRNHPDHANKPRMSGNRLWCDPCGPADVIGHRHDQSILSMLAHHHQIPLTDPPSWFAYAGGEIPSTILLADGKY